VPYIIELAEGGNQDARDWLAETGSAYYWSSMFDDLRSWNIGEWLAGQLIDNWNYSSIK
jgi:hypothetical protein